MVHTDGPLFLERSKSLAPTVRHRLFGVAAAAFAQQGYERASLNAILAAAGMAKSTFFYYFLDKEDLFASVLEAAFARVATVAGLFTLPDDATRFWQEATAIIERWGIAAAAEPGFVGLLRAFQPMRRTASPRLMRVMDKARGVYRALLTRGIEFGVVRSDLGVDTMIALTDAIDLVLDDEFHRDPAPDDATLKAHRSRVIDIVHRLIRP